MFNSYTGACYKAVACVDVGFSKNGCEVFFELPADGVTGFRREVIAVVSRKELYAGTQFNLFMELAFDNGFDMCAYFLFADLVVVDIEVIIKFCVCYAPTDGPVVIEYVLIRSVDIRIAIVLAQQLSL